MTEDDHAIDERIAREIMRLSAYDHDFPADPSDCLRCGEAYVDMAYIRGPKKCSVAPPYSSDLNHAAAMEARIEASGRSDAYIDALLQIVNAPHSSRTNLVALATASARQRCVAAIAMLESEGKQ